MKRISADVALCGLGAAGTIAVTAYDTVTALAGSPADIRHDLATTALGLLVAGGMWGLWRRLVWPMRLAFLHGYQKCREDMAAEAAGDGRVRSVPMSAYSDAHYDPAPRPRHGSRL